MNSMKPYDWMVRYTPQTEWIEGRGLLLWLAFYTGGLGGGLYLASLYFDSLHGMVVSWVIITVLKGSFHLAYLGKPLRFWRMLLRPQTSWVSRLHLRGRLHHRCRSSNPYLPVFPRLGMEAFLKGLAALLAFLESNLQAHCHELRKRHPLLELALVPVLFILYGILGGCALLMGITLLGATGIDLAALESASRLLMITGVLFLIIYLWSAHTWETGSTR
jgi:DMSO reductase anchor subunit